MSSVRKRSSRRSRRDDKSRNLTPEQVVYYFNDKIVPGLTFFGLMDSPYKCIYRVVGESYDGWYTVKRVKSGYIEFVTGADVRACLRTQMET